MRAATGSQWSSMSSGVTCVLVGGLNTRCAAACWIICSGFITHAGRLVRRTTCEEVLKDTYRRNAPISAVQVTRDTLHPKILSNMKLHKWANAHDFRNLTVTAKGLSQDSLWRKSVVVLYMWEKLPKKPQRCNQPSDQPQVRATLPTVFEERIHSERHTEESSEVQPAIRSTTCKRHH